MADKLRVGIIGCGGIAKGKHLPSLKTLDKDVDLVAFCDLIEERALNAREEYGSPGAKVYKDYQQLLDDKSIDVVHVLTPNRMHAEISINALQAGKHVMCEKPMAKSAADAHRMVDAAKKSGKKLTIGYQHRHKPEASYVKSIIDRGDLGEIYYAQALAVRRRGTPTWGVFLNEYEQGGGPLIDIGTHSLDLTLFLMNNYKPKMVVGTKYKKLLNPDCSNRWGPWDEKQHTLEDSAFGFIVMQNGATIVLQAAWCLNTIESIEAGSCALYGTKAGAQIKNDEVSVNKDEFGHLVDMYPVLSGKGTGQHSPGKDTPAIIEARRWIAAIKNNTDPLVLPEQACVVSELLEAIYTSAASGKPVTF